MAVAPKCSECKKKKPVAKWALGGDRFCSRGCRNIAWIEEHCIIPEGKLVGQPVRLDPFQKDIIRGIYGSRKTLRRAIISFARKNAKTTLCAMLCLLHLCGPEARVNSGLYSAALSRDQAAILFNLAAKMVRFQPALEEVITIRETKKQLVCPELGVTYSALSADASTNLGLSPAFIIHDELGAVRGDNHPLYEALETATAAQENPLSIIISTQAPNDSDLLSILIDDAMKGEDDRTALHLYTADPEADPFAVETIRQANPAFDTFQNKEEIIGMAEDARRMPSRENKYRNLILNQRVDTSTPFVTKTVWDGNAAKPQGSGPMFGGLDLSEVNDLTALTLLWETAEAWNLRQHFWLPGDGIAERSRLDRQPYDRWAEQGLITLTPGPTVEYSYVAAFLVRLFETEDVRKIAFDRWNMRHLKPWLIEYGMTEAFFDSRFVDFGQGYQSMSPALRTTEAMLLNHSLRHGGNPVLTMCAANAVVKTDEAGSRKLDKKRSRGRIDGMVTLVMAAEVAGADNYGRPAFADDQGNAIDEEIFLEEAD